jgi:hypothetical protein
MPAPGPKGTSERVVLPPTDIIALMLLDEVQNVVHNSVDRHSNSGTVCGRQLKSLNSLVYAVWAIISSYLGQQVATVSVSASILLIDEHAIV